MYKNLFFDLDHTLWDFNRNSAESIFELYETHRLREAGVPSAAAFSQQFITINRQLWADFDQNRVTHGFIREHRFPMVLTALGVTDPLVSTGLNEAYLSLLPRKPHLMEATRDILDYLHGRYPMHIITNGFDDIQAIKMASANITHYFEHVVTIETAGAKKPDPRMFRYAMTLSGARPETSLMIGDNYEADIRGANAVGMDTVFYNPTGDSIGTDKPTYEIRHWSELKTILK